MRQLSLAVVGSDYPNKRGPSRRFGIELCEPGDPVDLRREPNNGFDEFAIGVFEAGGVQLGYVRSERAAWLAPKLDRGEAIEGIFQEATAYGCAIRIGLGGEKPMLPQSSQHSDMDGAPNWYPDEEWPDD